MRVIILKLFLVFIIISINISAFSQENKIREISKSSIIDSLKRNGVIISENQKKPDITLSKKQALIYLHQRFHPQFWKNLSDPLRQAFGHLIYEAEHPPLDSLKRMLTQYPYDSLSISWDKFYIWEPLRLKIPVISIPEFNATIDTSVRATSDLFGGKRDSVRLERPSLNTIIKPESKLKDTTILVIIDTLNKVTSSYSQFPFKYFSHPFQSDSIKAAVSSILIYLNERDSTVISLTGLGRSVTPIMLNSKSEKVIRYWLKNEFSDSVTIWLGNPARNTIGLYLEQGVNFRRPVRQGHYANAKINLKPLDNTTLLGIQNIAVKSQFWKYRTETSFILNQASLSNWVRGGENSVSTALDLTGYADFNNKALKLSSSNYARLKFGYLKSGKNDIRKNLDLLETNSKFNHKAFGKFDFSAILLFKTQLARGYNYTQNTSSQDTSILVSKFMNPAILTIGFGLDYKPDKNTSLNFSPLSYKGTFVTDTAHIDQTIYGIAKNKISLNEPGVSFMITNIFKPTEKVTIVNRLQLFTSYINKPQNIDVDWEMIVTANLNWFTDVRFNTHLIFDDDTKTDELYKNGQPVLRPDGTRKRTSRIQFKEMLGFSVFFRF